MKNKKLNSKIFKERKVIFSGILIALIFLLFGYMYFSGEEYFKEKSEEEKAEQIVKQVQKEKKENGVDDLKKSYRDMIGWIEIPDSDFSYPVMQTGTEGSPIKDWMYYLHRDVYGNYSFYGTPFLDVRCTTESDNMIIYGHNINGRRYFGYLQNFREKNFFDRHNVLYFLKRNSVKEKYKIVAVIETDTKSGLYDFTDYGNEEDYSRAVKRIIDKSKYRNAVAESIGKEMKEKSVEAFFKSYKFITLSTCRTMDGKDKRLMVVACKEVRE